MNAARSLRRARGVTLIELMISIVIGLVVVAAVMVTFVNTGQAGRYEAALNQMNQDAQITLNMLSREVQLAGYVSPANSLGTASAMFGCDATKSATVGAIPFVSATVTVEPTCSATVTAPTVSALEVVYEADTYNTVPKTTGEPTTCDGLAAPVSGAIKIARNRYFVDRAATGGRPELYCASNAALSAKVPIAENVEEMQVWYGITTAATPSQAIRYAKAADVNAQTAGEWNNVMAARICLLMRSAEPILTGDDTQTYLGCFTTTTTTYTDRYLRRAYYTTATVRSKMLP